VLIIAGQCVVGASLVVMHDNYCTAVMDFTQIADNQFSVAML